MRHRVNNVKKTISYLLVIITVCLCACARTETDAPSGMKLASVVPPADYYMYVPNDWTVADQDGITAAYVPVLDNSSDKPNVTCAKYTVTNSSVFELPSDKGDKADALIYAENYWEGYVSELRSFLPGYELISGPTPSLLNGLPAVRCRYTASLSGTEYTFDMVICVKERMFAYMLTYTATSDKYDTYLNSYESIIAEFVFQTGVFE